MAASRGSSWSREEVEVTVADIECCRTGRLRIIASIEELEVIAKIFAHLEKAAPDKRVLLNRRTFAPLAGS